MKIKDIRNIFIDKIVHNNIGRNVISTTTGKDIDLLTRTSLITEGVEYKPIFDEKGLRIPVTVAQPSTDPNYGIRIEAYYQLIPKSVLIEILEACLLEINSNPTHPVIGKKAKVVLKRKRKAHK